MRFGTIGAGMLLGLGAVVAGCGGRSKSYGPLVPVTGKVTLAGKPLVGGAVELVPYDNPADPLRPSGRVDAQGNYSVNTEGKPGAPAGKYRVCVETGGDDKAQEAHFDPKYSHFEKSPLIIQVAQGATAGSYDLKMNPRRP